MRIQLDKHIFTRDPDEQFAKVRQVDVGFLNALWYRKNNLQYSTQELIEYFQFKTQKNIDRFAMWRWMHLKSIYDKAQMAKKMGAQVVDISYFKEDKDFLFNELTKHSS